MNYLKIATRVASSPLTERPDYGSKPSGVSQEHFTALLAATSAIQRLRAAGKFDLFEADPEVNGLISRFMGLATSMTTELNRLNELATKFESEV